ncbi:LysR family transcriptional regulator [Siminovitchia fortis]|uniref:LysR family transcriptional regulator n=1 Tax=Siminovitchia fortis TaxID=254758 RepID=A0A443IK49_9BACI|nr:LysR family transcriptional regulator [Siminovitchia fortis]RWR05274.1 LysR family transcriptional regulator [Siminovitchia fortis]WHY82421.1 LysR family transcriptional regulator [Siminovitchia fortis]
MNIDQLENIVEIAKTGSLTVAARNRNITISALSQSLSQLERELELLLFNRSRSGTFPTSEGSIIIKNANEVLMKLEELKENAQSITDTLSGQLRIGNEAGLMPLLMDIISELKFIYPNIQFLLLETNPEEIINKILNQEIDIGMVSLPENNKRNTKDLIYEKVTEGNLVIGANKKSTIASKKSLTLEELKNYPIALFNDEYTTQFIDDYVESYGPLEVFLTTNNLDSLRKVLSKNLALMLGIDYSFKIDNLFIPNSGIVTVDLALDKKYQKHHPDFYIVRLKQKHYSKISSMIVKKVKKAMSLL